MRSFFWSVFGIFSRSVGYILQIDLHTNKEPNRIYFQAVSDSIFTLKLNRVLKVVLH